MLRIQPTGNATFDAVEVTAYGAFLAERERIFLGKPPSGIPLPGLRIAAEATYLYACWDSARQQTAAALISTSTAKRLDPLTKNLATQLRDRGVPLPSGFWYVTSAVVASGGSTNAAVAGDILTLTSGATVGGGFKTAATFTVATVAAGPIPATVSAVIVPGFYTALPVGAMGTTVNTTLYVDCTLTTQFAFQSTLYNS